MQRYRQIRLLYFYNERKFYYVKADYENVENIFDLKRVWCIWSGSGASTPHILLFRQVKNSAASCGVLPRKKP
jgi:hypothetical protein